MTSSARTTIEGGSVMPNSLAVFRFGAISMVQYAYSLKIGATLRFHLFWNFSKSS
jgi:hypothetical protein